MITATMEVVSLKVDKKTRDKMCRLSYINWSEAIRRAIERKIAEEELKERRVDPKDVEEACRITDSIRRPSPGWSSPEEIRKWRERRRS